MADFKLYSSVSLSLSLPLIFWQPVSWLSSRPVASMPFIPSPIDLLFHASASLESGRCCCRWRPFALTHASTAILWRCVSLILPGDDLCWGSMHCSAIIDTSSPTGQFRKAVSKYVCLFCLKIFFRNYGRKKCCTVVYIFCAVLFQDSKVNCRNVYDICIEKFLLFSSFLNCLTWTPCIDF
jgi:hypothetical protein